MQLYEPSQLFWLWLLPGLFFVFLAGEAHRKRRLARLGKASFLETRLMPGFSPLRRRIGGGLLLTVFFFAALALARPQWGEEKKKIERKGQDVMFLLDTSLSMLAEDAKPDRLRKSKLEIKNLIRRFKGNRVGMVAFAGSSFLQCPLTLDYAAFFLFVDSLKPGYIPNPGTSLSRALELGVRAFPQDSRKHRAMIVFSDGEDHEGGVDHALEIAKRAGIRIYAIGVGTEQGEPIPLRPSPNEKPAGYKKDRSGQIVITRLNPELMGRLAKETGGLYLPATAGEREADVLLKHLETLGEQKLKERVISEREDHYQFFLLLGFLFLVGEVLLGERRAGVFRFSLPFLAFLIFSGFLSTPRSHVEHGNRNVQEKKYQSAVEDYRKAEVARPDDPVIRYNLGTALHQLYEYRDAEKELDQALNRSKDPATKAKILYNYGNTKYRLGEFEKAMEAYKEALDLNPKDEDAKYNLEFLRQKKAQFEKKNQEKQKEQKQNQKQPKPQQQKDQQQQQQPQPQSSQGEQKDKQPQPQPQQGNEQQKSQPQQSEEQQQEKDQQQQTGSSSKEQNEQEKERTEAREHQQEKENQEERKTPQQPENQGENEKEQPSQEKTPQGAGESQGSGQEPLSEEQPGRQPLQGQMSKENAMRILDALREGEKELQDLRRPPVQPKSQEPLKDW